MGRLRLGLSHSDRVTVKEARGGHSLGAEERDPRTNASPQVKGTLKEEPSDMGIFHPQRHLQESQLSHLP